MTSCKWFKWIGGTGCDGCGKSCAEHEGIEWIGPGGNPFSDENVIKVPWAEYGPGRRLDVPLLTDLFGPTVLAYLQQKSEGSEDEQ